MMGENIFDNGAPSADAISANWQYIKQLEDLMRLASNNIMCELSKAKMTLHEYGALTESCAYQSIHTPDLNFDQVNDLLCEQTANTLRAIMCNDLTPPELLADLTNSIDALNSARKRCGKEML